jgi:hypothetical protein
LIDEIDGTDGGSEVVTEPSRPFTVPVTLFGALLTVLVRSPTAGSSGSAGRLTGGGAGTLVFARALACELPAVIWAEAEPALLPRADVTVLTTLPTRPLGSACDTVLSTPETASVGLLSRLLTAPVGLPTMPVTVLTGVPVRSWMTPLRRPVGSALVTVPSRPLMVLIGSLGWCCR